jgi:hypothetical protein
LFHGCPAFAKKLVLTRRIVWFDGGKAAPSFNHVGSSGTIATAGRRRSPTTCGPRSSSAATCCGTRPDYKLANHGHDTRAIQHYIGHVSIASTVRYTALAPDRFKGF